MKSQIVTAFGGRNGLARRPTPAALRFYQTRCRHALPRPPECWRVFEAIKQLAGIAGLVLGKNPTLSPNGVRTILDSTATDLGAAGYDTIFGNGLVNATAALAATSPTPTPTP
jgi:hypothetical protein